LPTGSAKRTLGSPRDMPASFVHDQVKPAVIATERKR
jgi:hypothetical protein